MFILTLEWFGLPDARKSHGIQLEYGFKGMSNDELRQAWMAAVVPFMDEVGIDVPAHWDEEAERWVDRLPVPGAVRRRGEAWLLDEGPISWEDVHGALEGPRADERVLRERCRRATGSGWR